MAFTTKRDGNGEIYVMRTDGNAPVKSTNCAEPGLSPDWQTLPVPRVGGQGPPAEWAARDRTAPVFGYACGRGGSRRRALSLCA